MPLPVARDRLEWEVCSRYDFLPGEARAIVDYLEASGALAFHGPETTVPDPTTPDAHLISGLLNGLLGRSLGASGSYKIHEFLRSVRRAAGRRGRSVRA